MQNLIITVFNLKGKHALAGHKNSIFFHHQSQKVHNLSSNVLHANKFKMLHKCISPENLINSILAYLCVFSVSQINSNHGKMWIKREIKINTNNLKHTSVSVRARQSTYDHFAVDTTTKCTQFIE